MEEGLGQNNLWTAFYWKDYIADTAHLTMLEHGAYFLLMASYYASGRPLTAELGTLRRVCRAVNPQERRAVDSVLEQFFVVGADGFYHHARIDSEIEKRNVISKVRAAAGVIGGTHAQANAKQMPTHTHTHTQKDNTARKRAYPDDFVPNDSNKAWATKLGLDINAALEEFREFHKSKGNRYIDWHLAFNTWLRNIPRFSRGKPQQKIVSNDIFDAMKEQLHA